MSHFTTVWCPPSWAGAFAMDTGRIRRSGGRGVGLFARRPGLASFPGAVTLRSPGAVPGSTPDRLSFPLLPL